MLTRIEIDGFKTFKDFSVELAPFQVIVGPNGSGKSNLFDALHLLSRLADTDLRSAFQEMRGTPDELFMLLPNGNHIDKIRIAVEMLVDKKVQDGLGQTVDLKYTRLRYEISVTFSTDDYGLEHPRILHELLKTIPYDKDNWCEKYGLTVQSGWLLDTTEQPANFITTDMIPTSPSVVDTPIGVTMKALMLQLHNEEQEQKRIYRAEHAQQTVLSTVSTTEYAHAFAAREELRSLNFLYLIPKELRKPSSARSFTSLSAEGENLPATLRRMQAEDKFALGDVSRDMANLVPGIIKIRVEKNTSSNEYDVWADTSDQKSFSARVLSDGTLRLLALATLRNDPHFHGILCLEEPENGVHPLHLETMTRLLREMTTDFNDPQEMNEPLRQVLITTHSPLFISQPRVIDSLLLTITPTRVQVEDANAVQITRMEPVVTPDNQLLRADPDRQLSLEVYTIDMIRKYLDSDNLDDAREQLKKARAALFDRK